MEIKICMGSACHLKGSSKIVRKLQELVKEKELDADIQLKGSFCMGPCSKGVVVEVDGKMFYHLSEENVTKFFEEEIMKRSDIDGSN